MSVSDALRAEYAPNGVLRVALNHGNRVLVGRDGVGNARGITVDLAHALAQVLDLPLAFVENERAVDVAASATHGTWDICFLAVDPTRAEVIDFTHPYVRIEGSYLLGAGHVIADAGSLVTSGLPVATVEGSAYSLHLARQSGAEALVVVPDLSAALAALDAGEVAAIAGIRQPLQHEADKRPGTRVLEPPFMEIRQAMGMPSGRRDAMAHLSGFLAEMARTGRLGEILMKHGVSASCAVIP
jgi:polar amino acid transport system substrate-binding protein